MNGLSYFLIFEKAQYGRCLKVIHAFREMYQEACTDMLYFQDYHTVSYECLGHHGQRTCQLCHLKKN